MDRKLLVMYFVAIFFENQGYCQTEEHVLLTGGGCGRTSQVAGGRVYSHQPIDIIPPISNDFVCYFTIRALRFRQKIRFKFLYFSLTPTDCSLTNLTIYNGATDSAPVLANICPDDDVVSTEYLSADFWMTLKLQVSSISDRRTANFSGFYLGYTDDRDPCVDPSLEMRCNNDRCIYQELECDGLDSCGDNTDESTGSPSFCNGTTTTTTTATTVAPTASASTVATTMTAATTTEPKLFSNLTPLYIILTLAFVLFCIYLVYSMLSVQGFKTLMTSCLHQCFLVSIRRRRQWKTIDENSSGRLRRKITPEKNNNLTLENLSSVDLPRNETDNSIAKVNLEVNGTNETSP
ncbi:uncharacterized protein LOC143469522 [Clavelina lepadiformis]|uniref:uncharacterized protein LOC143469522 n=1 Tax=Clavelina lepadiformis TaxID=159417 RepID=UPI0040421A2B